MKSGSVSLPTLFFFKMFWLLSVSWISIWNLESTCQFLQRLSLKLLIWIVLNLNYFAVQYLSRVWLCNPMDCSMPVLPVHHQLLEFTQTHVHLVSDAIQPSHPLFSPSPPALNLSQHQGRFKWASSSYQVAKVLELQLQD